MGKHQKEKPERTPYEKFKDLLTILAELAAIATFIREILKG